MRTVVIARTAALLTAFTLASSVGAGPANADPWIPEIPGIPNIAGPGVNIGIPGNPLPPGQVNKYIPNVDEIVPNWGAPGRWR